jgi:hypothetical protein
MRGYSDWKVIPMFDYDDYYKVGRDVVEHGQLHWESRGGRYRDKTKAEQVAFKLNEETSWH